MGQWEDEYCGRAVLPRRAANAHALHGFRAVGTAASREQVFAWPEWRSARLAFAGAGRRSVGSGSAANRPNAPAESEQKERLGSLQEEEPFALPRRLRQPFLAVRQQEGEYAARRRRSPVAA